MFVDQWVPESMVNYTFLNGGSFLIKATYNHTIYNPGKKELGHLTHFIATIPVLAIVRTFGAMHCFKEAT